MNDPAAPVDLAAVSSMLDRGELDAARSTLARVRGDEADVLRMRLALLDGSVTPQAVMQRLVSMMQSRPGLPRANEVYQEASQAAYRSSQSSLSHSHPPPKAEPRDD